MDESLLDRFVSPDRAIRPTEEGARCPSIDFGLTGNRRKGFGYGHLVWTEMEQEKVVRLHFSSHTVTIRGRNLEPIYRRVLDHALPRVELTSDGALPQEETESVVEAIEILQHSSEFQDLT